MTHLAPLIDLPFLRARYEGFLLDADSDAALGRYVQRPDSPACQRPAILSATG